MLWGKSNLEVHWRRKSKKEEKSQRLKWKVKYWRGNMSFWEKIWYVTVCRERIGHFESGFDRL